MKNNSKKSYFAVKLRRGFSALLSALIISIILVVLTLSANFVSYLHQRSANSTEKHAIAQWDANSCMNIALFSYVHDPLFFTTSIATQLTETSTCTIQSVVKDDATTHVATEARYKENSARLYVSVKNTEISSTSLKITSWHEGNL